MSEENHDLIQETEPTFTIKQLQKYSLELFGLTRTAFIGATHGLSGEYTIQQMKRHIEEWLKKEVK